MSDCQELHFWVANLGCLSVRHPEHPRWERLASPTGHTLRVLGEWPMSLRHGDLGLWYESPFLGWSLGALLGLAYFRAQPGVYHQPTSNEWADALLALLQGPVADVEATLALLLIEEEG